MSKPQITIKDIARELGGIALHRIESTEGQSGHQPGDEGCYT